MKMMHCQTPKWRQPLWQFPQLNIIASQYCFWASIGYTDVGDGCWKRNLLMTSLTHIAKSWKIFPKIGWSLRGFLGKFFQTFFKISDFGSWVRSFSGKFFQPNFLSTYSGKKFVFWFRVMSEELFWKIFPASFYECLLRKNFYRGFVNLFYQ